MLKQNALLVFLFRAKILLLSSFDDFIKTNDCKQIDNNGFQTKCKRRRNFEK